MSNKHMRSLYDAIQSGDCKLAKKLLMQHPELMDDQDSDDSWLHDAAATGNTAMVEMLLDVGFNINAGGDLLSVVGNAISKDQRDVVSLLLERGADPDSARAIITAINSERALDYVKLLVEHGADINRVYLWFDDPQRPFTALSHALDSGKADVAEYLRSKGAVLPPSPPTESRSAKAGARSQRDKSQIGSLWGRWFQRAKTPPPPQDQRTDEVVAYFAEQFGPVQPLALIEIVPSSPPIAIHVVRAAKDRACVTLFTTGMSAQPMTVPAGNEAYRYAELFLQLPADWPLDMKSLANLRHGWPIQWLRSTAQYPHQNNTWLGGPTTIIANGEPPEPLAPEVKFTSLFLIAERDFPRSDGETVQLYRLLPLYTEERDLEISAGLPALMNAFDDQSIPFVVDPQRPNVGLPRKQ